MMVCALTTSARPDTTILGRWRFLSATARPAAIRSSPAVASGLLPEDISMSSAALGKALDRTTPAEIREIIATAIRLCVPEPGQDTAPPLDIATVERARSCLKHMIATAGQL